MVRKRNKLILIQQEATDSKSNFSIFSERKFFWVFFISHKIYPNYTILNISHLKLFLQEKTMVNYGVSKVFKIYGWRMLGIQFFTGKMPLVFCSSYFAFIAIRSSISSCLHPQFFTFYSYGVANYHKDKHTSHITFMICIICMRLYYWQLYQQLFRDFTINPFQPNIAFHIENSNLICIFN